MIELERLKAVSHVLVHENCPDGVASAMIIHDILPNAQVTFCQYESELQKTVPAVPGMLYCDFSPHQSRVQEFLDVGAIVLDHHGGAAKAVTKAFAEQGLGAYADEKLEPGVCGAMLAYREVWAPLWEAGLPRGLLGPRDEKRNARILDFATVTGVRDTWQRQDSRWQEACEQGEALRFWPWEKIAATSWDKWSTELLAIGPILYARNLKHVEKCIEGSMKYTSGKGRRITAFEGLKPSSDAAEMMGDTNELTIGLAFFYEGGEPRMIFSTRSRGGFNCQNFAIAHGGGGHLKAAGFGVPLRPEDPQPYELVKRVVARYEAVEEQWTQITSEEGFFQKAKDGLIVPSQLYNELVSKEIP